MDTNDRDLQSLRSSVVEERKERFGELMGIPPEDLLTREETEALLGVSQPTLLKWTKDGHFKRYGRHRIIFYRKSELLQALKPQ